MNNAILKKKELALAMSVAMLGGIMTGCSSDSSSGGAPGNSTINTSGGNGGDGAEGYAGDGGAVDLYLYGGLGGVNVTSSGKADTSFSSQKNKITPFLGMNPLEITSDTTIPLIDSWPSTADATAGLAVDEIYVGDDGVMRVCETGTVAYNTDVRVQDGTLYRWDDDSNELYTAINADQQSDLAPAGTQYLRDLESGIYTADEDGAMDDPRVSGISVAKDATLTLELNMYGSANISTDNDIVNNGTITTADDSATSRGDLWLSASSFISDGTIDTSGSGTVVNGGDVDIRADYSAINAGAITSAGADNAAGAGGDAGNIDIDSNYYTENTGDLTASGGNGTADIGGDGGSVDLYSEYGATLNSGDISTAGGNGTAGGSGDDVSIENEYVGGVLNSGDINTSGGSGSADDGGSAGDIDFVGYGNEVASSGMITAMGGDAAADFDAGSGGDLYLYSGSGYASWDQGTTPQGDIELSGDINLAGGNSSGTGDGGAGGDLTTDTDPDANGNENTVSTQAVNLLGYTTIDTSGGDGRFAGEGGDIDMDADYGWDDSAYTYALTGPVNNQADLIASAGAYTGTADTTGHRADGGDITLETSYEYADLNPETMVTNSGDITSNGADAMNSDDQNDQDAGDVWMWGYNGVNNSGTITLNGGNDSAADGGTNGRGGDSGQVELYAELGPVVNSGAITANGGNGEYEAGEGSNWTAFYGPEVRNTGSISGKGGDDFDHTLGGADNDWESGDAGYGGWIWMMGSTGPADVSNSGTVTLTTGDGYADWAAVDTTNRNQYGYEIVIGAHCEGDC